MGSSLRTLDFRRIKDAERASAKALFETPETHLPTKLALSLTSDAANSAALAATAKASGAEAVVGKGRLMTDDEKTRIRERIKGASSIDEVRRLEKVLSEGRVPEGVDGM